MNSEFVEVLFDDYESMPPSEINCETLRWFTDILISRQIIRPVQKHGVTSWHQQIEGWGELLVNKHELTASQDNIPVTVDAGLTQIKAILRPIGQPRNPKDDIVKASQLLRKTPSQVTLELFQILEHRHTPKLYQTLESYQSNLKNIFENKGKISVVDAYILEITRAICLKIKEPSTAKDEIVGRIEGRILQVQRLLESIFNVKSENESLKNITFVSVLVDKKKLTNEIDNIVSSIDEEPLKQKLTTRLKNPELQMNAAKTIIQYLLDEIDVRIPSIKDNGVRIEVRDLTPAINRKEIDRPHDRMIIANHRPEWCATAGFALSVKKDNILTPQGFFVKFWNSHLKEVTDFGTFISEKVYR